MALHRNSYDLLIQETQHMGQRIATCESYNSRCKWMLQNMQNSSYTQLIFYRQSEGRTDVMLVA